MGASRGKKGRAFAALVLAVGAAACSADDPNVVDDPDDVTEEEENAADRAGPDDAAFVDHGPYEVGITTLQLPDAKVEVFYPASDGSSEGRPKASYDIRQAFAAEFERYIPEAVIIPYEVDGYRELPVSAEGPFPIVLFAHGMSGWRTVNAHLATRIASWGFVVASTDYPERTLQTVFLTLGRGLPDPAGSAGDYGARTMAATLDLILDQGEPGGVLAGAVDPEKVAAVGHSAGGGTAFSLAGTDDRVDAVVAWATSAAVDLGKPLMIVAAEGDPVTANMANDVANMTGPTRVVTLRGSGHSVFIDICEGIGSPDGVVGRAQSAGVPLPDAQISLILDGCEEGDLPVTEAWPTILHFTVAQLRDALGVGRSGTGLGDGVIDDLPAEVDYQQRN